MSVQKRNRNNKTRWVGRYRDPAGKEHSKTFDTRREATAWVAERQRDMRRGEWIDPADQTTTIGQLVDEWTASATRPNTIANRRALRDNLGDLADMPIVALRTSHISEWRATLLTRRPWKRGGKPLAESTVAVMTGNLAGLLDRAQQDGLINRVPRIEGARAPSSTSIKRADLLTAELVARIITAAETDKPRSPARRWLARMIIVAAGAGLRISELAGLRVRDVDFLRREIHVREQAATNEGHAPLKSESAARTVPVPQAVLDAIAEQLAETPRGPDQTIWAREDGRLHNRNSIGRALQRVIDLHELPAVTMHDFRHFYASALIAAGVPVTGVQAALGHASAATTLRVYAHLFEGAEDVTRTAAARVMDAVRDQCGTGPNLVAL